ncbi:MAG: thioesterase II family protein, partial [Rhodanobacter sp.]
MAAPLNLLCLPYAGGNASVYREWSARMPGWVNVIPLHMPGRGVRQRMAPVHEWKALLDLLVDDVRTDLGRPFAIFGHSMGALIGVELAYELRDRYRVSPVWFGASACIAPSRRERED